MFQGILVGILHVKRKKVIVSEQKKKKKLSAKMSPFLMVSQDLNVTSVCKPHAQRSGCVTITT